MRICEVTGRRYLNARELKTELARLDELISKMEAIEHSYEVAFGKWTPVPETVYDVWNATSDAVEALKRQRADVAANPRPIPASEAGTYELVKQNID